MESLDKVFLLSIDEVQRYFKDFNDASTIGTPYAIHQGLWLSKMNESNYWLRDTTNVNMGDLTSLYSGYVRSYGLINEVGRNVNDTGCRVRVAMWIDLNVQTITNNTEDVLTEMEVKKEDKKQEDLKLDQNENSQEELYQKAIQLFANEEYREAYEIFYQLKDYKNSKKLKKICMMDILEE